jgi:polysaccharide biosynthesis/export protein
MKHTSTSPYLAVAVAVAFGTLAPLAADDPKTAKKPVAAEKSVAAASSVISDEYRLGPGDKLRIEVYKDPQLSQSVQVRPDGKITLPLVGDVTANNNTPIELRDAIATSLKEYITNPTVTVIVVEATAATAYVMGEVNHPGAVSLQAPLTVMQALALAGGLKDFADAKNIRILRRGRAGAVETIAFNYKLAMKSPGAPIYLRPGDTVVVPD